MSSYFEWRDKTLPKSCPKCGAKPKTVKVYRKGSWHVWFRCGTSIDSWNDYYEKYSNPNSYWGTSNGWQSNLCIGIERENCRIERIMRKGSEDVVG